MTRRLPLPALLLALASIVTAGISVPARAAAGDAICQSDTGKVIDRGDGWTSIAAPEFPSRETRAIVNEATGDEVDDDVRELAVDPSDPRRIFVTDGTTVMRSVDGGCSWDEVFATTDLLPADQAGMPSYVGYAIREMEISADSKSVYLLLNAGPLGWGGEFRVVASKERGDAGTWQIGAPLVRLTQTGGVHLALSPNKQDVAYLTITGWERTVNEYLTLVFKTADAGATWQLHSETFVPADCCVQFVIETARPNSFWLHDGMRSEDEGETWRQRYPEEPRIKDLHNTTMNGQPALAARGGSGDDVFGRPGYVVSVDGGHTWKMMWTPFDPRKEQLTGPIGSLLVGRTWDAVVQYEDDHIPNYGKDTLEFYRFDARLLTRRGSASPWIDITPPHLAGESDTTPPSIVDGATAVSSAGRTTVFSFVSRDVTDGCTNLNPTGCVHHFIEQYTKRF